MLPKTHDNDVAVSGASPYPTFYHAAHARADMSLEVCMHHHNDNNAILVSMRDVVKLTSLSRTMVCRLRDQGRFPEAVPLGEKRIGFVRAEVVGWVEQRIASRTASNDNVPANRRAA